MVGILLLFVPNVVANSEFIRGDANDDNKVDLSDAIYILEMLFQQGELLKCLDAGDANDDGLIDISDPVYILLYLFNGGKEPPAPFSEPGIDPTRDSLSCSEN